MTRRCIAVCLCAGLCLLAAAGGVVYALWYQQAANQTTATVYLDGQPLYSFDLTRVTETQTFTVGESGSQNTIQVSPAGIAVIAADRPDQVCVNQGARAHGPTPIVCLPNRLSIRFSDTDTDNTLPDAVSGTGGN